MQPAITPLAPDCARQIRAALAVPAGDELVQTGDVPLRQLAGRAAGRQRRGPQSPVPDSRGERRQVGRCPAGSWRRHAAVGKRITGGQRPHRRAGPAKPLDLGRGQEIQRVSVIPQQARGPGQRTGNARAQVCFRA